MATEAKLATAFVGILKTHLSPEDWTEMKQRNAAETSKSVCHSHDFCDANMAMLEAFVNVLGREAETDNESDVLLWNAAWELASKELK